MPNYVVSLREADSLREAGEHPPLAQGADLWAHERASVPRVGHNPPEAFTDSLARLSALAKAQEREREHLYGLMRESYAAGVGQKTIARWAGFTARWARIVLGVQKRAS